MIFADPLQFCVTVEVGTTITNIPNNNSVTYHKRQRKGGTHIVTLIAALSNYCFIRTQHRTLHYRLDCRRVVRRIGLHGMGKILSHEQFSGSTDRQATSYLTSGMATHTIGNDIEPPGMALTIIIEAELRSEVAIFIVITHHTSI